MDLRRNLGTTVRERRLELGLSQVPISSCREDAAPVASPSKGEGEKTDDVSGSNGVGGFEPRPNSIVRSFLRLSFAS